MLPYGKNRKFMYNYKDHHPKKGHVNWWEVELGDVNKGSERQRTKREVRKEVNMVVGEKFKESFIDALPDALKVNVK